MCTHTHTHKHGFAVASRWLPEGQLVPTVTNRANYIHWINDLLALSSPEPNGGSESGGAAARIRRSLV